MKAGADGALVRVSDVGRVELGAETYASNLRFLGLNASGIGIQLLPSANALEVFDGVMAEMARLERNFPPGLEWRLAFDNVVVVRESIVEVLKTLAEAIVLVILVMFLFLQNWRSTVIPAITIPVSLIGTFAFIKLFGFSINTLTLFGIVLATGIVVDDAIVVIENIERHMSEYKKGARQASHDAMREVFSAVVVIGLVLVAVFVPVAFFPGTTGRLYQQFSLTIAFSVVLSVFNAVTLTPALSALLLDREPHGHGRFFRGVNRVIDAGTHGYVRALRFSLTHRFVLIVFFVASLGLTWLVFRAVPTSFVPAEDEGYFLSIVQAPAGASLEYTTRIAEQAEKVLFKDPDIQAAFSVMGFSFGGAAPNNGMIFTRLKPYDERRGRSQSLNAVLGRVRGPLSAIPGANIVVFPPAAIQGLSAFGGFQFEVLDQSGGQISGLTATLGALSAATAKSNRVVGAFSTFRANDPQIEVDDRPRSRPQPRRPAARGHRRAAGVRRLAVRQRLRLQQPRLSRLRAGRSALPGAASGPRPALRAVAERRAGAARQRGPLHRGHGAAGHQPLQPVPVGGDQRQRRRPASARARRSPRWSGLRARCCRPASTSRGPARRSRK